MKFNSLIAASALLVLADSAPAQDDQPTLAKDSLQITAFKFNVYKKNYDVGS